MSSLLLFFDRDQLLFAKFGIPRWYANSQIFRASAWLIFPAIEKLKQVSMPPWFDGFTERDSVQVCVGCGKEL